MRPCETAVGESLANGDLGCRRLDQADVLLNPFDFMERDRPMNAACADPADDADEQHDDSHALQRCVSDQFTVLFMPSIQAALPEFCTTRIAGLFGQTPDKNMSFHVQMRSPLSTTATTAADCTHAPK